MNPHTIEARAGEHPAPPLPHRRSWRLNRLSLVVSVICLLGVAVLLLPTVANWYASLRQAEEIAELTGEVEVLGPQGQADELATAREYNEELTGGVATLGAGARLPAAQGVDGTSYDQQLVAGGGPMARIVIPTIGVDLPVYHGTSDEVLLRGAGHLEGTSLPVGGASTHAVLTAHRGLASAEMFTHLDEVAIGDTFTIQVVGEVLTYQVIDRQVVEPDETQTLYPRQGEDLVTLVTCTPLGVNSHRILVTGERVLPTPPESVELASRPPAPMPFPWWAVAIGGAVVATSAYVYLSGRRR
ncbi:class C sortase [Ruania alba]|uniref:Sortase A n=1 Tax=Ruania alba TaxID=648782 RepID=A0A1H5N2R6_9MICO|nr:class C sortase [Ruania alba]SEE95909.1 sortase A [Ruania alba]